MIYTQWHHLLNNCCYAVRVHVYISNKQNESALVLYMMIIHL